MARTEDRDTVLDAAKFLAIALVVVGHAVEPLLGAAPVRAAYLLIYAFHMPLFALLCGHVSKDLAVTDRRARRLLTGAVLPYLLFETAYSLVVAALAGRPPVVSPLDPYWLMWFLFALTLWRAALPYLARLRWPLLAAVAASVLVGYTTQAGNSAMYRTIGLLPFFVLGYLLPTGFHHRLRTSRVRAAAAAVFTAAALATWLLGPTVKLSWIYWRGSYASLGAGGLSAAQTRLLLLAAGLALSLAFLAWTPAWPRLARLGQRSMYVFLLHGFVVLLARDLGWYDHAQSRLGAVSAVALAVGLALVLASAPVRWLFRPLVEPSAAWFVRPATAGWRAAPSVAPGRPADPVGAAR